MTEFDDIRPYHDAEVPTVLARLIADNEFLDLLIGHRAPVLVKLCPWLLRPFLRRALRKGTAHIKTVSDLQSHITVSLKSLIADTTDGYTVSGVYKLDANRQYLFLSNHRDIALDPAMVNLALLDAGMGAVRIAIGDNLLRKPFASDLMRINRSFIVKRSINSRREKLDALKTLSRYIRHSITQESTSIWIAQREGRAKDGCDRTETALLKMLALSRSEEQSFAQAIAELDVVPVAISYEYDPCDIQKAREIYTKRQGLTYVKQEFEDLDTIKQGFIGYKGRIHVAFGEPVGDRYDSADSLADAVDHQVYTHYKLFPSNIIACQLLGYSDAFVSTQTLWPDQDWALAEAQFNARLSNAPDELKTTITEAYAAPVLNYLQAQQGS